MATRIEWKATSSFEQNRAKGARGAAREENGRAGNRNRNAQPWPRTAIHALEPRLCVVQHILGWAPRATSSQRGTDIQQTFPACRSCFHVLTNPADLHTQNWMSDLHCVKTVSPTPLMREPFRNPNPPMEKGNFMRGAYRSGHAVGSGGN